MARSRRVACQFGEVAVVAEHTEHAAEGGIDVAVGQPRGAQRDVDRVEQQGAGSHRFARGGVHVHQLGVVAEATARGVDVGEDAREHRAAFGEARRVRDDQGGGRSQRGEVRGSQPRIREAGRHEPPEFVTGRRWMRTGGSVGGTKPLSSGAVGVMSGPGSTTRGCVVVGVEPVPAFPEAGLVELLGVVDRELPGAAAATTPVTTPTAATEPATSHLVMLETRRSPRSRSCEPNRATGWSLLVVVPGAPWRGSLVTTRCYTPDTRGRGLRRTGSIQDFRYRL